MSEKKIDDRYRYMGLEMIPTPRYDVLTREPSPGTAWIYQLPLGPSLLLFNDDKVLYVSDGGIYDLCNGDQDDVRVKFLLDCAAKGLSPQEARSEFVKEFGEPDIVVELDDVNEAARPVRRALGVDETPVYWFSKSKSSGSRRARRSRRES